MFDSGYVAGCNIYYSITKLVHMNQIFSLMTVTSCNIGGIIGGFFGGFVLSVVIATVIIIIIFYQMKKKIDKLDNSHNKYVL